MVPPARCADGPSATPWIARLAPPSSRPRATAPATSPATESVARPALPSKLRLRPRPRSRPRGVAPSSPSDARFLGSRSESWSRTRTASLIPAAFRHVERFGEIGMLRQSEGSEGVEDGRAFQRRASGDRAEALRVAVRLAATFGDVERNRQNCPPQLLATRAVPARRLLPQSGRQTFMLQNGRRPRRLPLLREESLG
jgi:hypothetical protein